MIKCFVFGVTGKMGTELKKVIQQSEDFTFAGGFAETALEEAHIFSNAAAIDVPFDIIIDFSGPSALNDLLFITQKRKTPIVIATTGYTAKEQQKIRAMANIVPVFQSPNLSVGIQFLLSLLGNAADFLGDTYDIEIIEKHHNQKKDAPSGTAALLLDAVTERRKITPDIRYGRGPADTPRSQGEIGVHSIRGGTVIGEHEVVFYGEHEVVTISHQALSRSVFAKGALRAARFIQDKKSGLYHSILD